MNKLRTTCLILATFCATPAWCGANQAPAAPTTLTGEVLESKDAGGYTYLLLKTKDGETWAAVNPVSVKKGAKVTLENAMVMDNFESKSLKRTFKTLVFAKLVDPNGASTTISPHAEPVKPAATSTAKVVKASGANAYTVAEIVTKAGALKDKPAQVNGQVVKYNAGIMGKNWVHLRDGSGTAANNNHDILVTTTAETKVGEVVTASGVVRTNKDFGAGYVYQVILEEATIKAINK
jgi:hypothetical protein